MSKELFKILREIKFLSQLILIVKARSIISQSNIKNFKIGYKFGLEFFQKMEETSYQN